MLRKEMERSEAQQRDLTDKISELERVCETSENMHRRLRLSKQVTKYTCISHTHSHG